MLEFLKAANPFLSFEEIMQPKAKENPHKANGKRNAQSKIQLYTWYMVYKEWLSRYIGGVEYIKQI